METLSTLHPKTANGPWHTVPVAKGRRPKSADSSTKPLRSSPLTGPALNLSLVAFTAPSLTASNSEPTDHTTSSHLKSSQNFDSFPPTTFKRTSYVPVTAGGIRSSGRAQSLSVPDAGYTTRTGIAMPEWEIDSLQNPIPPRNTKSRLRPQTSSGIPSFRPPIPIVEEEADQVEVDAVEPLSKDISNTSASHTRDNSWYTANPYDVTPRFSRLGLSASNVVMPLSVKEHRRATSSSTSPILKRFSITSPSSPKSPTSPTSPPTSPPISPPSIPTRISLRPRSPPSQPLSPRPISAMSSSETSSIASTSQRETPTSLSLTLSNFASALSLTRSRNSQDSLSTWYESCPPPTPPECDVVLPAEHEGEECEGAKGEVGGGNDEIEGTGEFRGLHGREHGHDQIKYSDFTVGNDSDRDKTITQLPPSIANQLPTQTSNPPLQTSTLPKAYIERGRDSQQKAPVRIKLRSVDFDGFESVPSFPTMNTTKTMSTTDVGLGVGPVVVPPVTLGSENTLVNVPPLPTPTLKKKRSTLKSALKCFIKRWQ